MLNKYATNNRKKEKKKLFKLLSFLFLSFVLPCKTHTHKKNLKEKNHKNIEPIGKMMMNFIIFHSSSSTEFFLLLFLRLNFLFCFVIPMFLDSFLYFISKSLFFSFLLVHIQGIFINFQIPLNFIRLHNHCKLFAFNFFKSFFFFIIFSSFLKND